MKKLSNFSPLFILLVMFQFNLNAQSLAFDWVKSNHGNDFTFNNSITTDAEGNLIIVGSFSGTVDFDPGIGEYKLSAKGDRDAFVQKLDPNGNLLWVNQGWDAKYSSSGGVVTDKVGNIYSCMTMGLSDHDETIVVIKYNTDGDTLFLKKIGGKNPNSAHCIDIDENDNIYVGGIFAYTVDFDPSVTDEHFLTANGYDGYLLKLDREGNFKWVKQYTGGMVDMKSIRTKEGAVYVTGNFRSTVDFDPGVLFLNKTTVGEEDIFIQKFDTSGNFIWVKTLGQSSSDVGNDIEIDSEGNVIVVGTFTGGSIDFDLGPGTSILTADFEDGFILKLDASGDFIWVKKNGGKGRDHCNFVKIDSEDNIFITGYFTQNIDLNPGAANYNFNSKGDADLYYQKLDKNGDFLFANVIGGTKAVYPADLVLLSNGSVVMGGYYQNIVDFDPGTGVYNETATGIYDSFILKLSTCSGGISDIITTLVEDSIKVNITNATYQWLDCNNDYALISGANESYYKALAEGSYAVQITKAGCVDTSNCFEYLLTGINNNINQYEIDVFPNPTSGIVNIYGTDLNKNIIVSLFSISGEKISEEKILSNNQIQININQPSGVYFLELRDENGFRQILKLIKI